MFAAEVSERGLPAVWLTPLLSEASVIAGLARTQQATLLVGGTADAAWRGDAIPGNPLLEALELPGVDHGVQVAGDPLASLSALRQVTESVIQLAARI